MDRELSLLLESTDLSNGLIASLGSEIRSAEQYLLRRSNASGCDAPSTRAIRPTPISAATGRSTSLTTSDRYIVNKIASNQAQIEVAYATAHALADLGRADEARRQAERARAPADTLLGDVRALVAGANQPVDGAGRRAAARGGHIAAQSLWLLFFVSLSAGSGISLFTVRMVDRPLRRLIGAADRFGAGDLRPVQLGKMPTELERLARAMDDMGCATAWTSSSPWWARPARSATAPATSPP